MSDHYIKDRHDVGRGIDERGSYDERRYDGRYDQRGGYDNRGHDNQGYDGRGYDDHGYVNGGYGDQYDPNFAYDEQGRGSRRDKYREDEGWGSAPRENNVDDYRYGGGRNNHNGGYDGMTESQRLEMVKQGSRRAYSTEYAPPSSGRLKEDYVQGQPRYAPSSEYDREYAQAVRRPSSEYQENYTQAPRRPSSEYKEDYAANRGSANILGYNQDPYTQGRPSQIQRNGYSGYHSDDYNNQDYPPRRDQWYGQQQSPPRGNGHQQEPPREEFPPQTSYRTHKGLKQSSSSRRSYSESQPRSSMASMPNRSAPGVVSVEPSRSDHGPAYPSQQAKPEESIPEQVLDESFFSQPGAFAALPNPNSEAPNPPTPSSSTRNVNSTTTIPPVPPTIAEDNNTNEEEDVEASRSSMALSRGTSGNQVASVDEEPAPDEAPEEANANANATEDTSQEEEDLKAAKKSKVTLVVGLLIAIAAAIGITVGILMSKGGKEASDLDLFLSSLSPETRYSIESDPLSPQAQSLEFIMGYPDLDELPLRCLEQRFGLATIIYYLDSFAAEEDLTSSLQYDVSECDWLPRDEKPSCDLGSMSYRRLTLTSMNLTGNTEASFQWPREMSFLSFLNELVLTDLSFPSETIITDLIPSAIHEMPNMQTLRLSGLNMAGTLPTELGLLTDFTSMDFSDNNLSGSIPHEIFELQLLEGLSFENNNITGTLPSNVGNSGKLYDFSFIGNAIHGTIPTEIGLLSSLLYLRGAGNDLTGTVPTEMAQLTNALVIQFTDNELTGSFPREIGNLRQLRQLSFDGTNIITGKVPADLCLGFTILNFNCSTIRCCFGDEDLQILP